MTTSELIERVRRQDEKLDALTRIIITQAKHLPGCIPFMEGDECACGLAQAIAKARGI